MSVQLSNATLTINNVVVAYAANTLTFTEGLGEQNVRAASAGGNQVDQIFSKDVETQFSTVKFDLPATVPNIAQAREWKVNEDQNLVQISGETPEGRLTRTFSRASLMNDYEVALGKDTNVSIEFRANPAV